MPDHQNNIFTDFVTFNETHPLAENLKPAYYQLGLICSLQALPTLLDLEKWLLHLWQDQTISFDNERQAAEYAQKVLELVGAVQSSYEEALPLSELGCTTWLNEDQLVGQNGVEFAAGFLAAIELFNAEWLVVEHDENTQNILQTTILLLTKLAPPEEVDQQLIDLFEQLPAFSEILHILPQLLSNLAFSAAQALQFRKENFSE